MQMDDAPKKFFLMCAAPLLGPAEPDGRVQAPSMLGTHSRLKSVSRSSCESGRDNPEMVPVTESAIRALDQLDSAIAKNGLSAMAERRDWHLFKAPFQSDLCRRRREKRGGGVGLPPGCGCHEQTRQRSGGGSKSVRCLAGAEKINGIHWLAHENLVSCPAPQRRSTIES